MDKRYSGELFLGFRGVVVFLLLFAEFVRVIGWFSMWLYGGKNGEVGVGG